MKNEKENPLLHIISTSKQSDFAKIEKKLLDIKMRLDNSTNDLLKKTLIDYFRILYLHNGMKLKFFFFK